VPFWSVEFILFPLIYVIIVDLVLFGGTFHVLSFIFVVQVDNQSYEAKWDHNNENKSTDNKAPIRAYIFSLGNNTNASKGMCSRTLYICIFSWAFLRFFNDTNNCNLCCVTWILENVNTWLIKDKTECGNSFASINCSFKWKELPVIKVRICV